MVVFTENLAVSENLYVSESGFVFNYHTGETYIMNVQGVFILREILKGTPSDEISYALEEKYGISHRKANSDIDDFLEQLSSFNLLLRNKVLA